MVITVSDVDKKQQVNFYLSEECELISRIKVHSVQSWELIDCCTTCIESSQRIK